MPWPAQHASAAPAWSRFLCFSSSSHYTHQKCAQGQPLMVGDLSLDFKDLIVYFAMYSAHYFTQILEGKTRMHIIYV